MLQLLLALTVAAGSWTYSPEGSTWRPAGTPLEVARTGLKQAVLAEARATRQELPDWKSYAFSFQGREIEGRRVIYVYGSCDRSTDAMVVADGGPCYFTAIYDVRSKVYAAVAFNGYG